MLLVPIQQARPGMTMAMPVMHPHRPDTALLRPGFVLDDETLARLHDLRLPELWVRYPGLEMVEKFVSPRIMRRRGVVAARVREVVASFAADAHAPLPYGRFADTIRGFIEAIYENTTAAVMIQSMARSDMRLSQHAADVCFLSLLLGMRLDEYLIAERHRVPGHRAKSIVGIGLGAMVADVGILQVAPDALDAWTARGSREDDPIWRQHVELGYARVRGGIGPAPAAAVLHHHQHFDGTGFPEMPARVERPRPLRGREIHVFARVVGAADLFQRLKRPMNAESDTPTVRVLASLIRGPQAAWIDPVVRGALLSVVPAFAPGSVVRLSTTDRAVVVAWDPNDPCRPTVRLIPERLDRGYAAEVEIDLRRERHITVVEADGVDVSPDLFDIREAQSAASDAAEAA